MSTDDIDGSIWYHYTTNFKKQGGSFVKKEGEDSTDLTYQQ